MHKSNTIKLLFIVFIFGLFLKNMYAGTINCGKAYTMSLDAVQRVEGDEDSRVISHWHMELEKVKKRGGLNGLWKLTLLTVKLDAYYKPFDSTYFEKQYGYDQGDLGSMNFNWKGMPGEGHGNIVYTGPVYFDVYNGKIGNKRKNLWYGTIRGDKVTLQFWPPELLKRIAKENNEEFNPQYAFTLLYTGYVNMPNRGSKNGKITLVVKPTKNKNKIIFDEKEPGTATIEVEAKIQPSSLKGVIEWEFDKIVGSEVSIYRRGNNKAVIVIKKLPADVNQFGKHKIKAIFKSEDGKCTGEAIATIKLYYLAFAENHPPERNQTQKTPNWFYYWKQTPAARPHGQIVRLIYGGRTLCNCKDDGVVACYKSRSFNKIFYICDTRQPIFKQKFIVTYPLLDRRTSKKLLGWRSTYYIDSFAVSIIHEFQHYLDEMKWDYGKTERAVDSADKDDDGIPDYDEKGLGFDPTKKQTYQPTYEDIDKKTGKKKIVKLDVGGDEEWIAYESMRDYKPGRFNKYDWGCPGAQIDDNLCKYITMKLYLEPYLDLKNIFH